MAPRKVEHKYVFNIHLSEEDMDNLLCGNAYKLKVQLDARTKASVKVYPAKGYSPPAPKNYVNSDNQAT